MITRQTLQQWCGAAMTPPKALKLCHSTFGAMSPFALQPSVLALANDLDSSNPLLTTLPTTAIPARRGSCLALLRNACHLSVLRDGIILPLVWRSNSENSRHLPAALQQLASRVTDQLSRIRELRNEDVRHWGLSFDRRFVPQGLTFADDLFETFESAYVSLAVGLISATQGFEPNLKAVGSAAWSDQHGISPVTGLTAKIEAAIDFHAADFFLPAWQIAEVLQEQPMIAERIKLHPLTSGTDTASLWPAVQPMLAKFASIPPAPAWCEDNGAFDVCVRYHQALPPRSDDQKAFYQTHLLNSILSRCRDAISECYPNRSYEKLATIVSGEKDVTLITILSVGVKQCLLLHTSDDRQTQLAMQIVDWLQCERSDLERQGYSVPVVCPTPFSNSSEMLNEIAQAVGQFTQGCPPESTILDIKPGLKRMTYALTRQARTGNWIFDLNLNYENNLPVPGTEIPELWQAT